MAKLTVESLEFAKNHIVHYWDSDFFPKSFEFDAIRFKWTEVVQRLTSLDISEIPIVLPRCILAPKPNGTYRVVHQLNPLNTLAYTAMVYLVSGQIEKARAPKEQRISCSYRISPDVPSGNLFAAGNGYVDFTQMTRECLGKYKFILKSDIADFYNQIYLHRLQNGIAVADTGLEEISKDIELFLTSLNDTVSRGVPVGPPASIILAEALLTDIDNFILSTGFVHTRYVDDLRIFANSYEELDKLLQELTLYLHKEHRLILASYKTQILDSQIFLEKELDDPQEIQRRELHKKMEEIGSPYEYLSDQDETKDPELTIEQQVEVIKSMMKTICDRSTLDLGLARHVLRVCKRYRIRAIVPILFEKFDFFAPVMPDLVLYLDSVTNPQFIDRIIPQLTSICESSPSFNIPFVKMWIAYYLAKNPRFFQNKYFSDLIHNSGDIASFALATINSHNSTWARELRHRFDAVGPYEKSHILRASIALSKDERKAFYNTVKTRELTFLERCVLEWAASISN
ncbi:MAG: hypothetical protein EHM64_02955 [Ignavibacteriae bacterium]|nr:MAG: hypothetical protein EHM64_02955 [Ignavibacteriota bacterium]